MGCWLDQTSDTSVVILSSKLKSTAFVYKKTSLTLYRTPILSLHQCVDDDALLRLDRVKMSATLKIPFNAFKDFSPI
jgi:hypothetical protein